MVAYSLLFAGLMPALATVPFEVVSVKSAGGTGGMYTASIIGGDGLLATSSFDPVSNKVRFVHCKDADCKQSTTNLIGQGGRTQSMVATSQGLPVIGLCSSSGKFEVAACEDQECSQSKIMDTGGSCRMYTSASAGVAGGKAGARPAFAFSDHSGVYLVRCSDASCSSVSSPRRIAAGDGYPGVAVLPDDVPVVAFIDRSSTVPSLNLATCKDAACSEASTTLIDGSSDFAYSAITVVDALPVVLAANDGNSTMMVFKCHDAKCANYQQTVLEQTGPKGAGSYGEFPHIVAAPPWLQDQGVAFAASYYHEVSESESIARVALCSKDLVCDLHTIASGKCGYGRDASIAFGVAGTDTANRGYYSFMKYSTSASGRNHMLAVLSFDKGLGATGHEDICKDFDLDSVVHV